MTVNVFSASSCGDFCEVHYCFKYNIATVTHKTRNNLTKTNNYIKKIKIRFWLINKNTIKKYYIYI